MKTFSSILILCLAFTFGNAQDVTVHAESDPAADFNNYKTFTIVDRDEASASMNQDQNRSEGEVTGSGYGTQGATGTTQQGTDDTQGTYGTTGDQNDTDTQETYGTTGDQENTDTQETYGTTGDQNNTDTLGTYGTTGDQNNTDTQGTYGTTGDQNNTDTQGTYGTTGDQNNTDTQGTYGTTGDQDRSDESMADVDEENVDGDDVANQQSGEFGDREDMNTEGTQTHTGTTGTTNSENNENEMGNTDESQNEYGTTNQNQSSYGTTGDHKSHAKSDKKALKEAIKSEMESRGFTYTEGDADLVVNYSVFDGEASVSMSGDQGNQGYTAWGPQIGENSQVELEDGSVVIHLVDAEKNQLVFSAYATGAAEDGSLENDEKVKEAVSKIFDEIPGSDR